MKNYLLFRGEEFYPVELPDDAAAIRSAALNPGTTKILDAETGAEVWSLVGHLLATRRWCYTIIASQDPSLYGGYVPSVVIENHPGHFPMLGKGEGAAPWVWGKTLAEAELLCEHTNEEMGYSVEEAFRISASTFKQN